MSVDEDEVKAKIKAYILDQFLADEDPGTLQDSTQLISGGYLDSVGAVTLVGFLEENWDVSFDGADMTLEI